MDELEAVATTKALQFSLEVGINQGKLQDDSKVVMKSLADKVQPLTSFATFNKEYQDNYERKTPHYV